MRAADRQRLAARARQRGAVLLPLGPWPGADAELGCVQVRWQGASVLDGGVHGGAGRLCARRVHLHLRGRGVAPGGGDAWLLLPGPTGLPAVDDAAVDAEVDATGGSLAAAPDIAARAVGGGHDQVDMPVERREAG
jgi:hypothetical protein